LKLLQQSSQGVFALLMKIMMMNGDAGYDEW